MTDFLFKAHFPLRSEISAISFVCNDADDALQQWNQARDHDGLPRASRLPPDTEISVLSYDDQWGGVYIQYSGTTFATLLRLPETTDEDLEKCEEHLVRGQDEGYSCDILDMSSFSKTASIKSFDEVENERIAQHNIALAWLRQLGRD